MSEVVTAAKGEEQATTAMANICNDLFVEWLIDLTVEEK